VVGKEDSIMYHTLKGLSALSAIVVLLLTSSQVLAEATKSGGKSKIEVAFVLDTTGSMEGLIEGAKVKIWSIANEIVGAEPTPDLKLGLIGYRDKGDEYITRVYDLSDDLDAMYEHLQAFKAAGGGDAPESVNQALYEAVTRMKWAQNTNVLKIIFLVGDAPPHMNYRDDVKYPEICKIAVKKDLIINTVQCGSMQKTTPVWQKIARLSEGKYVQIGQSGGMVVIDTPMDRELENLNRELGKTTIAYGGEAERRKVAGKVSRAASAPKAAIADRLKYLSKSKKVVTGGGDLVSDTEEGSVKLEEVTRERLPEKMKGMSKTEQKAYVKEMAEKRMKIQARIDDLLKQRNAYIKKEMAKNRKKDAFDEKVAEMIQEQAGTKGIVYKK